jgi:hypothetical protein
MQITSSSSSPPWSSGRGALLPPTRPSNPRTHSMVSGR